MAKKKLIIGIIMFVVGALLKDLSYVIDMPINRSYVGIFATVITMVGFVLGANAINRLSEEKKNKKSEEK